MARRSGLTLIELIVVLSILAGVVALAWPSLRKSLAASALQDGARQLQSEIRWAQAEAVRSGQAMVVWLPLENGPMQIESLEEALASDASLPASAAMSESAAEEVSQTEGLPNRQDRGMPEVRARKPKDREVLLAEDLLIVSYGPVPDDSEESESADGGVSQPADTPASVEAPGEMQMEMATEPSGNSRPIRRVPLIVLPNGAIRDSAIEMVQPSTDRSLWLNISLQGESMRVEKDR
jgi:prepilin-type N-terminal cleavage/methylation domain-containing protein